jgi:hypothetical protein
MIKQQDVDGRSALVAYLKADMTPVDDPDDAELLRVVFDNGDTMWLIPQSQSDEKADE